ncbi:MULTISPECIES: type IV pilus modification protein PilV [unclassified Agarivorans]|uniref:type IV pilus modification protein PilV n=1 Tax=unclassified Agarivorans TaxID=2636026 RepID=UPI003D7E3154
MRRHQPVIAPKVQGFTLIELLIALVVVSIGLLGHAALQIQSVNTAQQARFAQTANTAMLDMIQRVLALPEAARNNEFNAENLTSGVAPSFVNCDSGSVSCTRAQFAAFEVGNWYDRVSPSIPQLRFSLQHVNNLVTLRMTWDAHLTGSGVANCDADRSGNAHQCSEVAVWVR